MPPRPWPDWPANPERFREPPREYGILPFWFLNDELDSHEMRLQLRELRDKGMPGIIHWPLVDRSTLFCCSKRPAAPTRAWCALGTRP